MNPVLGHIATPFLVFGAVFVGLVLIGPLSVGGFPFLGCSIPYADWIYTVLSLSGLLLICWLVLVRSGR